MTTVQMHYFLVAAEQLNFTIAAEQLYITQPALSRQINAIEDEVGTRLFARSNNVIALTKAGKILYQRLSVLYNDYLNVMKDVRAVGAGVEDHLNLGILEDQYMVDSLTDAIRLLVQNNPNCELNISRHSAASLFSGLREGSIDASLMLIYEEYQRFGFESLPLDIAPAQLAIRKGHPFAELKSATYADLDVISNELPLVMADLSQFPEPLQQSLRRFPPFDGVGPSNSHVKLIPYIGSVALYVTAGLGITLTNRKNLLANDPNVNMIPLLGVPKIVQGLVWRKSCRNALLNQLIASLNIAGQPKHPIPSVPFQ